MVARYGEVGTSVGDEMKTQDEQEKWLMDRGWQNSDYPVPRGQPGYVLTVYSKPGVAGVWSLAGAMNIQTANTADGERGGQENDIGVTINKSKWLYWIVVVAIMLVVIVVLATAVTRW